MSVDRWADRGQAPGALCHAYIVTASPQEVCRALMPHLQDEETEVQSSQVPRLGKGPCSVWLQAGLASKCFIPLGLCLLICQTLRGQKHLPLQTGTGRPGTGRWRPPDPAPAACWVNDLLQGQVCHGMATGREF